MIEGQKIVIIGGTGKFGQHMGEMLEEGNEILISGSSLEKAERIAEKQDWTPGKGEDVVEEADLVIFSVPISLTVDLIEDIGPHIKQDALICDVTSVKEKPCEAMQKYSDEVLGMHPMYAPSNPPEGQNVVLCPVKGKKWTMMEEFWMERNAEVHIATPEEHDRAMAIIQGLTHFTEMVFAQTLSKMNPGEKTEEFASPIYRIISDLTGRMLNQQSELYESIQLENERNEDMRKAFVESAEEMSEAIGSSELDRIFDQVSENFDLEGSQDRSDAFIEFMRSRK